MGLVVIMVGVLADDYGFHGVQWCMSRPLSNIVNNGWHGEEGSGNEDERKRAPTMNRHPPLGERSFSLPPALS